MNSTCKRFRVVCPDCGAGGANDHACFCHVCEDRVLMLPATQNWNEVARLYKGEITPNVIDEFIGAKIEQLRKEKE